MKKYLFLLLLAVSISYGQTTVANKLKITGNSKNNNNTRVMVGDSLTKEINFIMKSSLLNRANHTGEQPISTITNLQDSLSSTTGRINILEDLQNLNTSFTAQAYAVWTGVGFIYDVIYPSYYIQGVLYPSGTSQITLDASDPDNPRLDVIAVDATGVIKVTGFAEPNPVVPTINTDTQIQITTVLVNANATIPVQASTDINVYKENVEWVGTSPLAVAFSSSLVPFQGTVSAKVPAYTNTTVTFTAPAAIQSTQFDLVTFYIRLGAVALTSNKITLTFVNGASNVSNVLTINDGQFNFKRTVAAQYQLITVPIGSFTFISSTITALRIGLTGTNPNGVYLDNIVLSKGLTSSSPLPVTLTSITTDNGVATATINNDSFSIRGLNGVTVSAAGKGITVAQTNQDISGKEDVSNKQNSLAIDGTGAKYPTVDAVNAGISSIAIDEINPITITTEGYTLQLSDSNKRLNIEIASTYSNILVPTNATVAFPIGTKIKLVRKFPGTIITTLSGVGVTFINPNGLVMYGSTGQEAELVKLATNTWKVSINQLFYYNGGTIANDIALAAPSFYGNQFYGGQFGTPNGAYLYSNSEYLSFGKSLSDTSGIHYNLFTNPAFTPTSGAGIFNLFNLAPTINQTGGANGITRGLYINPTLTSAFDWRALEITAGKVILPSTTDIGTVTSTELGYVDGVTSGIQGQLNTKITANTSTNNYLPKVSGANTFANSRLFDDGTYLGIETETTPTKDITFGNQTNREVGIEKSNNTVVGRNLTISAGKATNYLDNNLFVPLNLTIKRNFYGMVAKPNGDIYAAVIYGNLFIKFNGTTDFIDQGIYCGDVRNLAIAPNGDIYRVGGSGIFIQVGGTGAWTLVTAAITAAHSVAIAPNGDVYVGTYGLDVWIRTGGVGNFTALSQINKVWSALAALPNGDILAMADGNLYQRTGGTGNFTQVNATNYGFVSAMAVSPSNGNVYASRAENASILIRDSATGIWSNFGQAGFCGYAAPIAIVANGSVYCQASNQDVYFQNNDQLGLPNLNGGTLKLSTGTGKGTGASDIELYTGQKLASGTDMQLETLRAKIDNEGLMTLPSVTNALITADVTGKAVVTKEYVSASTATKSYKTYFINSSTGNNTTGVYEDSSKPFATIDYVLALPALLSGDIIYLQNRFGNFPLTGVIPTINLTIASDTEVTLDFSSNNNTYFYNGLESRLTIDIPNGIIRNERNGGTGTSSYTSNSEYYVIIKAKELYLNSTTPLFVATYCKFNVDRVSAKTHVFQDGGYITLQNKIEIVEFVCLGTDATLAIFGNNNGYNAKKIVSVLKISGSGSFLGNNIEVGDISTTLKSTFYNVTFKNSIITTTTGVNLPCAGTYISGIISSSPRVDIGTTPQGNYYGVLIKDFTANIGDGQILSAFDNLTILNSNITSSTTPIIIAGNYDTYPGRSMTIKNTVFDLNTPAVLVSGGNGAAFNIKAAAVSTNATSFSNGTGVTVTQFTNY